MTQERCQAEVKKTLIDKAKSAVSTEETHKLPNLVFECRKDPYEFLNSLTPTDLLLLNYYLRKDNEHNGDVRYSHTSIGKDIGRSREEVCRRNRILRGLGLIQAVRYQHKPCVYRVNPILKMKSVIKRVAKLLPALLLFASTMLTPYNYVINSKINNKRISSRARSVIRSSKNSIQEKDGLLAWWEDSSRYVPPEFRKRGGKVMTKGEIGSRVHAVEKVAKTLDLTKYGKASLSIYPECALLRALDNLIKSLKRGNVIKDPFRYLCSLAHKETSDRGLSVNYYLFNKCDGSYQFAEDEDPLNSSKITLNPLKSVRCNKRIPDTYHFQKKEESQTVRELIEDRERTVSDPDVQSKWSRFPWMREAYMCFMDNKLEIARAA